MKFAQRLKEIRLRTGKSQKVTAELMGMHTTTYQRWEDGINEPKVSEIIKMTKYFNVSADYLLGLK